MRYQHLTAQDRIVIARHEKYAGSSARAWLGRGGRRARKTHAALGTFSSDVDNNAIFVTEDEDNISA